MEIIRKKDLREVCNEIELIIEGSDNKSDYKYIYLNLDEALTKEINYAEIELICKTVIKIAKTKNKILRFLEKDFWRFINKIPFKIILLQTLDFEENEELLSNKAYENENKRVLSRLIRLAQAILRLKDDNSKGSDLRRAGSLRLLVELINYYHIPAAKELFLASINSKNAKEQYTALEGLENYYNLTEDEITADLVQNLNLILKDTKDRSVASTCLQIQINAGIINGMTAISEIGKLKVDHYK